MIGFFVLDFGPSQRQYKHWKKPDKYSRPSRIKIIESGTSQSGTKRNILYRT